MRQHLLKVLSISIAVCVPIVAVHAASETSRAVDEGGICTDLGCIGGSVKCADGTLTMPGGSTATYTCYTTIRPS